jgi:hypothetical protein
MNNRQNTPTWKRFLSLKYVISKAREKGFCGTVKVFWIKGFKPILSRVGVLSKRIFFDVYIGCFSPFTKSKDTLYAYYDLATSALDFGVYIFLLIAERERIRLGLGKLCLVVVPEKEDVLQQRQNRLIAELTDEIEEVVKDDMEWRMRNIIVPSISLVPSRCQVNVFLSRKEAHMFQRVFVKHIFPMEYSMSNSIKLNSQYKYTMLDHWVNALKKGPLPDITPRRRALSHVGEWIELYAKGRKVITITLRESSRFSARNSSLSDWGRFARTLNKDIYYPVILRDTEKDFQPVPEALEGVTIFHQPVWNIELRAALYELSYLNMGINNGPSVLFEMNRKAKYLLFKILTPSIEGTSREYFEACGLNFGHSIPQSTPFQKLVWEDDNFEVIKREFEKMCEKIEQHESNYTKNDESQSYGGESLSTQAVNQ